jgi:hypothetical protein
VRARLRMLWNGRLDDHFHAVAVVLPPADGKFYRSTAWWMDGT